jgi:hydroxymethylbilane synthase
MTVLRIGTRGSQLARWQAEWVSHTLRSIHPGLEIDLVEIKTHGDRDRDSSLAMIGGIGLFTKEIQRALQEGVVDVAVHSLKDLPTTGPDDLIIAAVPPREDVADALIAPRHQTLEALPPGSSIGTGSLRRRAQLLHIRPDVTIVAIRGNVETRLRRATDGNLDAVVLALAGLRRLGLDGAVTERLSPPRVLPAVGQGALGIECRRDDATTLDQLSPLNDAATHAAVAAERALLAELEGGCMAPLGAWGRVTTEGLVLDAAVFDIDGREKVSATATGDASDPVTLGRSLATRMRELGADALLRTARRPV